MRTRYLISYDICHPKRLRKVAKLMEGYGVRLQYSVFECALDEKRLQRLRSEVEPMLHCEEDQILLVSLGPEDSSHGLKIEAMGLPYLIRSRVTIV